MRSCRRVRQLEEQFRLAQLKRYAPSSEKRSERVFNEAEHMGPEPQQETVALPGTGLPGRGRERAVAYPTGDTLGLAACARQIRLPTLRATRNQRASRARRRPAQPTAG